MIYRRARKTWYPLIEGLVTRFLSSCADSISWPLFHLPSLFAPRWEFLSHKPDGCSFCLSPAEYTREESTHFQSTPSSHFSTSRCVHLFLLGRCRFRQVVRVGCKVSWISSVSRWPENALFPPCPGTLSYFHWIRLSSWTVLRRLFPMWCPS